MILGYYLQLPFFNLKIYSKETDMDGLAAMSFIFGMVGMVAFVRLQKLTKTLKEKGILEEDYKKE